VIEPHVHERPTFAVMLNGAFDLKFTRHQYACTPTSVSVEPAGERHSNFVASAGAEVLVLQPDPAEVELWRPFDALFQQSSCTRHGGIGGLAARIANEADRADAFSELAMEALALEMLVAAARVERRETDSAPRWLVRVQEILHEQPVASLRTVDIAAAVGVHPAQLARTFRRHFHVPIGTYARRRRLEWAARCLAATNEPIAGIAARAGFADQSHLTRAFKRYYGLTPDQHRRRYRPRAPSQPTAL
jgi:AraC family transcriptional regulator